MQLTDAEGTHIPVTEEGGDTTAVENAKDPKPEPISKDKVDAPIESKQKLPEEAHNAATWATLPGPEEVPTPLRLSQRSPETPLAPSLEESPHSAEEQKKQKKTEEEKKRSDKAEEEATAKEAQESGENKIVPPKTPEKAKFQQDQNSHLETPNAGQSTAPSMSPGNSSIKSATNLPGGYQQSPEKAGKEEEGEGQQSSSIMKSCLISECDLWWWVLLTKENSVIPLCYFNFMLTSLIIMHMSHMKSTSVWCYCVLCLVSCVLCC